MTALMIARMRYLDITSRFESRAASHHTFGVYRLEILAAFVNALLLFAVAVGLLGRLAHISDVVAYALILWVAGVVLISFGWRTGRQFWPPVLHLVFMLPLPGTIYYKVSTSLQFMSSELGVWVLQVLGTRLTAKPFDPWTLTLRAGRSWDDLWLTLPYAAIGLAGLLRHRVTSSEAIRLLQVGLQM